MTVHFYKSIIEQFPIGFVHMVLLFDDQGNPVDFEYLEVNRKIEEMFLLKREQLLGKKVRQIPISMDIDEKELFVRISHVAMNGGSEIIDLRLIKTEKHYTLSAYSPQLNQVFLFFTDITESISTFSDSDIFFRISPDLLSISRTDGLYLKVNPAWTRIMGYEPEEVEGKTSWQFLHPDDQLNNRTISKQLESNHQVISFINRYRHKDGSYRYIEWDSQLYGDKIYSVARDITERNEKEERIAYLSFHDVLTGLYNRRFLEEEVKRLDVPRNLPLTIVMGDVNRLKLVNDAFGREKGDELIVKAAESIKNSCRPDDLVARWGGDEFLIFLPKTSGEDAQKIIERIHSACMDKSVNSISVSIAFGTATKAFLNETISETMRLAEDAMYKSKAKESERSRKDIIDVIAGTLYSKFPYEEQHAKRVSFLCQELAKVLGLSTEDIQKIALAGLLHDIGKIAIAPEILKKKTALSEEEWKVMRTHTQIGAKVVGSSDDLSEIGTAILHHHERFDGTGYPEGISWENIPIASRIITLADSYDTMISQSIYKTHKTRAEAITDIRQNKGTQFDPQLAELFITEVLGQKKS